MKRAICFFLCLILITVSLGTVSLAVHENSLLITECIEDSWIVDVKGENMPDISDFADKKFYLQGEEYALHYDAYSQLDRAQKIMYNAIVNNPGKLSITINFSDGVFAYSNFTKEYFTELMNAVCTDRPDIFYYAGYGVSEAYLYNNRNYISELTYECGVYDESIYTSSNLPGYYNALMAKIPQVPVDLTNRYSFIVSIREYIADTVYYPDLNTSDYVMSAHDAYGALIEGRAVCQGYSDAVKLICDYYNIPCVCISGTSGNAGHMWNAIQMEDGIWYLMDLTWDDQDSYLYDDFFLVGTQSTNTYFGGLKFCEEHINDADLALPNLQYAATKYTNTNHFTGFKGTYNSYFNETTEYLSLSVFDYLKTPVYYNGICEITTPYQGYEFNFEAGSGEDVKGTIIVVGDPDGDDELTDNDYDIAKDYLLNNDNEADDVTSAACDVNCDGYVDALDLALLNRGKSGVNTKFNLG